jgi:hypothetical protein
LLAAGVTLKKPMICDLLKMVLIDSKILLVTNLTVAKIMEWLFLRIRFESLAAWIKTITGVTKFDTATSKIKD